MQSNREKDTANSKPVPKIDLTLFTTGDGTVVSTKERIIKGKKKKLRLFAC